MASMNRREFIKTAAATAAGAALGPIALSSRAWATPLPGKPLELKIRQDLIYDGMFDVLLNPISAKSKNLSVKSSYIKSDLGWEYERDNCLVTPPWYTEGEPCQIFLGRGPAIAQLVDDGVLDPLDDLIDASDSISRDDFHRSRYGCVLDSVTYRGKLWGMPLVGDTYSLFCNKDLFKAAGVESYPSTWKETIESAKKLTRDTNGDGQPDVFGYSQCSFQFPLQIITAGLDFVDVKNKLSHYGSDPGVEALDTYQRLKSTSPPHVNFENGDMAMKVSVTTNSYGKYKDINHTITRLPEGRRRANTYADSDGVIAFAIAAGLDQSTRYAAWKVIEYMLSEKMYFKLVKYMRNLPLRNSIRTGEKYAKYVEKFPQAKPFLGELEWAVPKPCIPEYRFLEVVMREILLPVQKERGTILTDKQLREHMQQQADRVDAVLAKSTW